MRVSLILCAFFTLITTPADGGEQFKMAVSPAVSMAPSNVNIRVRLARNADNRMLEVIAESSDFYRSSQVQLDGEQAPALINFEFRSLPGGEYQVIGIVTDATGHQRAFDRQSVKIIQSAAGY
jgi:hypothetical protein